MNRADAARALAEGDARAVLVDRLNGGGDAQPDALVALGLLYVGDELAKVNAGIGAAARGIVALSNTWATVATVAAKTLAEFAEHVAPAQRNGAGEVVGRSIEVSAALRAEGA